MASGDNSPFHWLGLLKWSLAYSDGTQPTEDVKPMDKADIDFLEKVMKEGIIDEGERMKTILSDLTGSLESMLDVGTQEEKRKELDVDDMLELLQELRDIVEQIDYARAFMAMGGIPFLLGCATYEARGTAKSIPKTIRKASLGVLSTMCQNNPPVQLSLLEHGHMPQLIQLFYDYSPGNDCGNDRDDSIREKAVQALSASIRGHAMAEHIFCQNEQGVVMLQMGMGMQNVTPKPSVQLRKRSIFLLRAIVTSDDATPERKQQFKDAIEFICTHEISEEWEEDAEIREMCLATLSQLLHRDQLQPENAKIILKHKSHIASIGVARIQEIRNLEEGSEEKEYATLELDEWERLMMALAEASND